jgi:NAD(P)H-hydrate epimerase
MLFDPASPHVLLTNAQSADADAHAATLGVPTRVLMEAAGRAVARIVGERFPDRPVLVLCGPGNNGGDGFVAAEFLANKGTDVRIACLVDPAALKGDSAAAAADLQRPIERARDIRWDRLDKRTVVIDALFGAGLTRPLEGEARALVEAIAASGLTVVAVDVPSGVDGDTGQVQGAAAQAALTVTFERKKPAHLLYPGRALCGEIRVEPIGMPTAALTSIAPQLWENHPALWLDAWRPPGPEDHKYTRGKLAVFGGPRMPGAATLAAHAAMRAGAGLVSLLVPETAWTAYASTAYLHLIVKSFADPAQVSHELSEARLGAAVVGPGAGGDAAMLAAVEAARTRGLPAVFDADALAAAVAGPLTENAVLTPHDGEFRQIFPALGGFLGSDRIGAARRAAAQKGAIVVLKGAASVIAAPDGRTVVNGNAPPWLATAGSGDVLAGLIGGLLAQGMPGFAAAAMGVWLHGAAARHGGLGLVATDLPDAVPSVLKVLHEEKRRAVPGSPTAWR